MIKSFISNRLIELSTKKSEHVSGTLLFMDISGFTKLSESLSQFGKSGTEELTKILNEYFNDMLKIIKNRNGDVLKFGGDALLVGFYGVDRRCKQIASYCAQELMQKIKKFKSLETRYGHRC